MIFTTSKDKSKILDSMALSVSNGYRGDITLPSGGVMTVDNLFTGTVSVMPKSPCWRADPWQEINGAMADTNDAKAVRRALSLVFGRLDRELLARHNKTMAGIMQD
jgi:hypothetical protein